MILKSWLSILFIFLLLVTLTAPTRCGIIRCLPINQWSNSTCPWFTSQIKELSPMWWNLCVSKMTVLTRFKWSRQHLHCLDVCWRYQWILFLRINYVLLDFKLYYIYIVQLGINGKFSSALYILVTVTNSFQLVPGYFLCHSRYREGATSSQINSLGRIQVCHPIWGSTFFLYFLWSCTFGHPHTQPHIMHTLTFGR